MAPAHLRLMLGQALPGHTAERLVPLLAPWEQERAVRFLRPEARAAYVTTWAGLRVLLASELTASPPEVPIDRACEHCSHPTHGRPRLPGGELSFSVARSEGRIAWLVTRNGPRSGVDLEVDRPLDWAPLAQAVLSPREIAAIEHHPPALRSRSFLELWTQREAVGKAFGAGLFVEATDAGPGRGTWSEVSARSRANREPSRFWTRHALVRECVVAVAAQSGDHLPPTLEVSWAAPPTP